MHNSGTKYSGTTRAAELIFRGSSDSDSELRIYIPNPTQNPRRLRPGKKKQKLKYTSWQKTSHPKIWSAWQTLNFIEKKWTSGLISFADTLCQTQFQWYERNLDMTPTFHTFCYAPFFLSYLYSSVFWRTYHHSAKIIVNWQDNVYDSVSESESRKFYRLSFGFDSGKNGRRQPTPTPVSTPTLQP